MSDTQHKKQGKGNFGWAVLGFFVPVAGLVLFLVWKNENPGNSKMAGIGALVSVILDVVCYIFSFLFMPIFLAFLEKLIAYMTAFIH
ncbi:MAG: hypothetical protein E7359_03380 [Clostridiales bacterium]|nr:hypothetical protein [Clostridiales bacterium]